MCDLGIEKIEESLRCRVDEEINFLQYHAHLQIKLQIKLLVEKLDFFEDINSIKKFCEVHWEPSLHVPILHCAFGSLANYSRILETFRIFIVIFLSMSQVLEVGSKLHRRSVHYRCLQSTRFLKYVSSTDVFLVKPLARWTLFFTSFNQLHDQTSPQNLNLFTKRTRTNFNNTPFFPTVLKPSRKNMFFYMNISFSSH